MKLLISGVCGFVGSTIARTLLEYDPRLEILGLDNFSRPGSYLNAEPLRRCGVKVLHADVRAESDMDILPRVDWVIDAAANPSVLAGVVGMTSSRQLIEHNLNGTTNLLELAKKYRAGLCLLSTSRVYSINILASLPVTPRDSAFELEQSESLPEGVSPDGITEDFPTSAPISLYGATKLASECLALEYGAAFGFPVWVNRCGVLAGAGQFGRADQGIFAFWINAYLRGAPLKYVGFNGSGCQVRDCFHPRDLVPLVLQQMKGSDDEAPRILNLGGGAVNSMSLAQLSGWCADRFGAKDITSDPQPRPFDLPWVVMDTRRAKESWNWSVTTSLQSILEEIALHAEEHPDWLQVSAAQ
jgi:CDP-paratose 2-epimerase